MKRLLRWLVVLLALGALGFVFVRVPFGGKTLWERLAGPEDRSPASAPVAAPPPATATDSDQLTAKDRRDLDRLIESKLDQKKQAP